MVGRGDEPQEPGWRSGRGQARPDSYAPADPPVRRRGRHGRPGAPDSQQEPGQQHRTGGEGEYGQPGPYGPAEGYGPGAGDYGADAYGRGTYGTPGGDPADGYLPAVGYEQQGATSTYPSGPYGTGGYDSPGGYGRADPYASSPGQGGYGTGNHGGGGYGSDDYGPAGYGPGGYSGGGYGPGAAAPGSGFAGDGSPLPVSPGGYGSHDDGYGARGQGMPDSGAYRSGLTGPAADAPAAPGYRPGDLYGPSGLYGPEHPSGPQARADYGTLDHGALDHGALDHGALDHGALDHGALDHGHPLSGPQDWAARPDPASPASGPWAPRPDQSGPQDWTARPDQSGPQDWTLQPGQSGARDRLSRAGQPGTASGRPDWAPDQSGPLPGARDWAGRDGAGRDDPLAGPHERTAFQDRVDQVTSGRDWTARPGQDGPASGPLDRPGQGGRDGGALTGPQDWAPLPGHTGPQRRADATPGSDPLGTRSRPTGPQRAADPRYAGDTGPVTAGPVTGGQPRTPYDDTGSQGSLAGLPAAAAGSGWDAGAADEPPPWDPRASAGRRRTPRGEAAAPPAPPRVPSGAAAAGDGPGLDGQDHPDWAAEERHTGFFQGFGDDDGVDPPRRRHGRWMAPLISLVVILAIIGTAGGLIVHEYAQAHANYPGGGTGQVIVLVRPGDNATTLAPRLIRLGVIKASDPFVAAAKDSPNSDGLVPGTFRLRRHMNAAQAWDLLVNPDSRIQTTVTIPDGMRATDVIASLARQTGKPLSQFQQALSDTAALGLPAYANGNAEGYLYPNTYNFQPGTTPLQMLQTMVSMFKTQVAGIDLPALATKAQLSPTAVITEASLLEAEVRPADYAMCARTIDNRLNQHIKLGLDSTILYALHRSGSVAVSNQMLQVNSPYNTYQHLGLPPGPIDSPNIQAITAVVHPAQGNWIYFIAPDPKTGKTDFTASIDQFNIWKAQLDKNLRDGT